MSDISQESSSDEDIAPCDDKMNNSDATQSQEECNDGSSVSSSSDIGEGYEVSSIEDLEPELQAIKGSLAEILFYSIQPQ
jgi:hypothetical protein